MNDFVRFPYNLSLLKYGGVLDVYIHIYTYKNNALGKKESYMAKYQFVQKQINTV